VSGINGTRERIQLVSRMQCVFLEVASHSACNRPLQLALV